MMLGTFSPAITYGHLLVQSIEYSYNAKAEQTNWIEIY